MIELNFVCVGSLKEKYWVDAINEYKKRLGAFAKVNIIEVKEFNSGKSENELLQNKVLEAEFLKKHQKGYSFALEIGGKAYNSVEFAEHLNELSLQGNSHLTFFIGGSNGLDSSFSKSCNEQLSFSAFTFPHQLMRIVLIEQIYRAFTILNNKTYHK